MTTSRARLSLSDSEPAARYIRYVICLLFVVNVFNYMDRMALSVLAPSIQADLRLSDTQLGLLSGFAFAMFYAVCGIPIARWADRGVRKDVIALALATWSVVTALTGAAQSFWQLFLARVGVGVGEAGGLSPAQSMICDYVPLIRRPGAFAVNTFALYAGMMLGMVLAGWLGETIGWRWTFVALGLPGLALAAVVKFTLREPRRGFFETAKENPADMSFVRTITTLWRRKTYRLIVVWSASLGFVLYGLGQWWPSYYVRVHGLSLSSVGLYLGLAIGAGSGIGIVVGGLLANKAARRDVRLPLLIAAAATALAVPAAVGSIFVSSVRESMLLVTLTALFSSVSNGPAIAALYSVVTSRMRATAGSFANFFTAVLGFGLGPFCVGLLSDALAPSLGVRGLRYALLVPISFLAVVVVVLYAAAKTLPDDLIAVGGYLEAT